MAIRYKEKDYLLVSVNNKVKLGQVVGKSKIRFEDSVNKEEGNLLESLVPDDVVANLGRKPKMGKAFGVNIEPHVRSSSHKKFGNVDIYRNLTDKELSRLFKALDKAYSLFKSKASTNFLPLGNGLEIRAPSGKMAGMYKFHQKKEENCDVMTLRPIDFNDSKYNLYVVCHEMAHGLWYRCVPPAIKAKWIRLYQKRMVVRSVSSKSLGSLAKEIKNYQCDIRAYMREMGDEDIAVILREVLSYIKRMHRMDARAVMLACEEDRNNLDMFWPDHASLSEPRADVSEYALKSVEEFFAESVAFHLTGKKLPKDVEKALKSTFSRLTTLFEN